MRAWIDRPSQPDRLDARRRAGYLLWRGLQAKRCESEPLFQRIKRRLEAFWSAYENLFVEFNGPIGLEVAGKSPFRYQPPDQQDTVKSERTRG